MFKKFLWFEFKNCIKSIRRMAIWWIAILLLCISFFAYFEKKVESAQSSLKAKIVVLIPKEEEYIKILIDYVTSQDNIAVLCDTEVILYEDEVQVEEGLYYDALVTIPPKSFEKIYFGEKTQMSVDYADTKIGKSLYFRSLVNSALRDIHSAESAVYAFMGFGELKGLNAGALGDEVALDFVRELTGRNMAFRTFIVSDLSDMDRFEYYYGFALLILLLFQGFAFGVLYQEYPASFEKELIANGLTKSLQRAGKILVMTAVFFLELSLIASVINICYFKLDPKLYFVLLFLCLGVSTYINLVMSLTKSKRGTKVILFIIDAGMLTLSGAVIPTVYLPDMAIKIGAILPLSSWYRLLSGGLFGGDLEGAYSTFIWIVLGIAIPLIISKISLIEFTFEKNKKIKHVSSKLYFKLIKAQIKLLLKNPLTWLQIAFMMAAVILTANITLPSVTNKIGFLERDREYIEDILDFTPVFADDVDTLKKMTARGEIDCAFEFSKDFATNIEKADIFKVINCYSNPFSIRTNAAKEAVYATIFEKMSIKVLQNGKSFEEYKTDENTFILEKMYEQCFKQESIIEVKQQGATIQEEEGVWIKYPERIVFALILGLIMLYPSVKNNNIKKALKTKEKLIFGVLEHLCAGVIPAIIGIFLCFFLG